LYVALDVDYISGETFDDLIELAKQASRLIGGLRSAVAKQKHQD
jgi:hypothetical protein